MFGDSPMTRREVAGAAALGAMALAALPEMAEAKPPAAGAIHKLLTAHNKAFNHHDLKGVLATMGPNAVLMGTGPGELWVGHAELSNAYMHFFKDFKSGSEKWETLWANERIGKDLASLLVVAKITSGKKSLHMNMSVVCERKGSDWLIQSMHFSNLTEPGQA